MRKLFTKTRLGVVLAAVALAAGAGAGIAYASIPDSGSVIHGCYKTPVPAHGSPLSVIDTGAGGSCPSGTAPLNWNALATSEYMVNGGTGYIQPGTRSNLEADCQAGDVVTGGGFETPSNNLVIATSVPGPQVYPSGRLPYATGWTINAYNPTDQQIAVLVFALCMHQSAP